MGGLVMATEFRGSTIPQTRMWPDIIVMSPPDFDQDAGLGATTEPFHAQALVAELAIETFVGTVLPGFAGVNRRGRGQLAIRVRPSEPS